MVNTIRALIVGSLFLGQMASAGSGPERFNDSNALDAAIEYIRPDSSPMFWQSIEAAANSFQSDLFDPKGLEKLPTVMFGMTGGTFVLAGTTAEAAMKLYGVKDPVIALAMMYEDFAERMPRLQVRFTTPGSTVNKRLNEKIGRMNALRSSQSDPKFAAMARRHFRTIGVVGGVMLGTGLILDQLSNDPKNEAEVTTRFESSRHVMHLLASDISNDDLRKKAINDEALAAGIRSASAHMSALEMWAEVYQ